MGLDHLFGRKSDLSLFSRSTKLYFDSIIHAAKMEINEDAVPVQSTAFEGDSSSPANVVCDHPFIFLIYDNKLNQILFTGVYRDPSQN